MAKNTEGTSSIFFGKLPLLPKRMRQFGEIKKGLQRAVLFVV